MFSESPIKRRKSTRINVGNVPIGDGAPIAVQSMTNTDTMDIDATVAQIQAIQDAGADIVRVSVPTMDAAEAFKSIKEQVSIPLVADIHFDYRIALKVAKNIRFTTDHDKSSPKFGTPLGERQKNRSTFGNAKGTCEELNLFLTFFRICIAIPFHAQWFFLSPENYKVQCHCWATRAMTHTKTRLILMMFEIAIVLIYPPKEGRPKSCDRRSL